MPTTLGEHTPEILFLLIAAVSIIGTLIGFGYRGLIKRIEGVESKIPIGIITLETLKEHCETEQVKCPFNARIEQIALDTKYLRENIGLINEKQAILREQTLPDKYLKIVEYEKNHLKVELMLKDNIKEIKTLLEEKTNLIKDVIDKLSPRER